ncbi:MAG TPA: hypothetical protein VK716_05490 [Terracidiphilus sp.]|jgi:hypothetical protein|nr:hypothetical protein [Terracidiphilus sp.]
MSNDLPQNKYQAAFDEAALELHKIQQEFQRLSLRRERIAKVVEVLKPKVSFDDHVESDNMSLTSRRAGLTVVTRLAIMTRVSET